MVNNNYNSSKQNNKENDMVTLCSEVINRPLSQQYANADVYLPNSGILWKIADELKRIPSSQMRKILDEVKGVVFSIADKSELTSEIKSRLFMIVPMTAYVYGRNKKSREYENLYNFIKNNINSTTIKTIADIKTFDKMYTCIIAYHKTLANN